MQSIDGGSVTRETTSPVVAIVGATLIDGNGGPPLTDSVILIDGKRIIAVGDRSTPIPRDAARIAASGKFVIPGLMVPFQFLVNGLFPDVPRVFEGRYNEVAIEGAQLALKGGVTTVFDCWGPRDALIEARDAINEGLVSAARIYLCGNIVGYGGPYSEDFLPQLAQEPVAARINSLWEANVGQVLTWKSPEQVREEVRRYVQSGIDFLTYAVNARRPGAAQYIVFSPRVQQIIVEEAHRAGLAVQAMSVNTGEGLHLALSAGVDVLIVDHTVKEPLHAEMVRQVAQQQIPCSMLPSTTTCLEWYRKHPHAVPSQVLDAFENKDCNERALIRAGALLLSGWGGGVLSADAIESYNGKCPPEDLAQLGDGHVNALVALQQKGMEAMEVLLTATRNVARAFKVDKDLGSLERGKFADLLILDKDPLQSAEYYRSVSVVMKEGKIIDRDTLPTQRLLSTHHE